MIEEKNIIVTYLIFITIIFFSTLTLAEDSRRTFFEVNNLSCGFCIGKIDKKLKTFNGYIGLLANIDKELVAVDHRLNLNERKIAEAITSMGYPAKVSEFDNDPQRSLTSESPGWRSPSKGFFAWVLGIFSR